MKVILLQNIKKIGQRGEIKDVSDGYALNFLFPRKLAEKATPVSEKKVLAENLKKMEDQRAQEQKAKMLAEKINGMTVEIFMKSKKGKLFGSITAKEIKEALKRRGIEVEEEMIDTKHVEKTGEHEIRFSYRDLAKAKFTLAVKSE